MNIGYFLYIDVLENEENSLMERNHEENSLQIGHETFGHQSKNHTKQFLKIKGIETSQTDETEYCDGCAIRKFQRTNFGEMPKASKAGELIVSDIGGPMQEQSFQGSKYFVTFKGYYTQYYKVYFMQYKNEVKDKLQQFLL